MKKRFLPLILAALLLLSGCAALLERSYGEVQPYADRYWDDRTGDTLRAENYQDLVNSLLMLVEQRAESGVIRCYGEANDYGRAVDAQVEVQKDTMLGAYLLERIRFRYENNESGGYGTLTYELTYREDAENVDSIMTLSDSQSLVDLLRLAVREGHERLTVRFSYDMPRENVIAAVESLWQELYRDEMETREPETNEPEGPEPGGEEPETPEGPEEPAPSEDSENAEGSEAPKEGREDEPAVEYPPCPWTVRFYPDRETAELVEILLAAD